MLLHPLYETLRNLKLDGVIKGLLEQESMPDIEQVAEFALIRPPISR